MTLTSISFCAHKSRSWSIGWVDLSLFVRSLSRYGNIRPNLHFFFNIYRHRSLVLTHFHLIQSSTKLFWPSTTKYQPELPYTEPVLSCINQFRFIPTQSHQLSTLLRHTDSIQPSTAATFGHRPLHEQVVRAARSCCFISCRAAERTNHYHPILTQYHQLLTCIAFYRPSTIKY